MRRVLFLGVSAVALTCTTQAWANPAAAHRCVKGSKARACNRTHRASAGADSNVREEISQLRAEIADLRQQLAEQTATTTRLAAAPAPAPAPIQTSNPADTAAIATLTEQNADLSRRVAKMEKPDRLPFKGITITPGGFLEMTSIYRTHNQGADIASTFNNIPFLQSHVANTHEFRMTARQSRLSLLAEGDASKETHLAMYGEFDFQAAGVTANSNQSNSYSPRIRNLYGTIDQKLGGGDITAHVLFGQNWSLATMNSKGITPRAEVTPPVIEAQYVPGFTFTRQPQVRVAVDFDKKWWFALSLENPQTTFTGTVPSGFPDLVTTVPAGSGFGGNGIAENAISANRYPDVIGKVAYEGKFAGRTLHIEAFGMVRDFYERLNGANHDVRGWGAGGSIGTQIVPGVLDAQFSGIVGDGIGRYGAANLADVTYNPDGTLTPLREYMLLAGLTAHPTKMLDVYVFGGEEWEDAHWSTVNGVNYGLGNPNFNGTGCLIEGSPLPCTVQTRAVKQITAGFWQRALQGPWGRVKLGIQYIRTWRDTFTVNQGGAPTAKQDMGFFSIRYYPF